MKINITKSQTMITLGQMEFFAVLNLVKKQFLSIF